MRRHTAPAFALALVPFATLFAPAEFIGTAHAQKRTEQQISEDIEFARGLASSWQFLDLAENVLNGVAGEALSPVQREELELARCEVFASGARTTGDDTAREGLFDQALDGYRSFLDSYPASTLIGQARRDYVGVAGDYATHMSNLLEGAAGEEATRIRKAIEDRLTKVLSDAAEAIADLEEIPDRSDSQDRLYWSLRIDRGRLLVRLGRASKDGTGYLRLAEDEMGTVAFEAPSDSSFPLQAFMVLGEVYLALGQISDAADTFQYVAEESIPQDRATWDDLKSYLSDPQMAFRWLYLEEVTPSIIEAYMQAGRTKSAADAGLHLLNMHNLENFEYSPRGDLAAVATARCLFESGGSVGGSKSSGDYTWFQTAEEAEQAGFGTRNLRSALELSLQLALDMSESGRGIAADRAKALIADLIESPGLTFGPEVLFQAAKGAYDAREYGAAISAFRRVLASVQADPLEAKTWSPKVFYYIGECYKRQGRDLEATMAYLRGYEKWKGDPEYDARNVQAGYQTAGRVVKLDPEARTLVELRDQFGAWSKALDLGGDFDYEQAKRKFESAIEEKREDSAAKKFEEAAELFRVVPPTSPNYGLARARIGISLYRAGKVRDAGEAFDEFESERTTTTDKDVRARLDGALKLVRFFQGQVALDTKDWATAFEIFSQYPTQFPDETDKHDVALANAVEAAVATGQTNKALELTQRLAKDFPNSSQTLRAAGSVFKPLYDIWKDSDPEGADHKAVLGPLTEITVLRNKLSTTPNFDLMRLESRLWIERKMWDEALTALERINTTFANDAEMAKKLEQFVKPDLGITYISLDRLPEAHKILAPLVPDPNDDQASRPATDVVDGYVKSVAGWMKGDPTKPTVMAGVGGAEELEKAYVWATKLTRGLEGNSGPGKYTAPWFEARFVELWVLYQWGKVDSSKMDSLKSILGSLKLDLTSDFSKLTKELNASPDLAARYRWLDRLANG
ncbi:MAG: tetratricopeptide repeat protein [Planctomycetota bacterium]